MVLLGYKNESSLEEVISFLKCYEISYISQYQEKENVSFIEIESKSLCKMGLCALGKKMNYNGFEFGLLYASSTHAVDLLERSIMLFDKDIHFWKTVLLDFVNQFGLVAIRRQYEFGDNYPDETALPDIEIKETQLSEDLLFTLKRNQTVIITH